METITMLKPISPAEIAEIIKAVKPGDTFKIQFKESEIRDVAYLAGMHNSGFLTVKEVGVMDAVTQSRVWGAAINRIFEIKANANWNPEWFSGRLQRRIEAIEILN
jgi:hypothetical protein